MQEIFILNHLSNTQPNDHNSFDSIITNDRGQLGKYRTVKKIVDNTIASELKPYTFSFTLNSGELVEDGLIRRGSFKDKTQFTLTKVNVIPGEYNPRVFRPFLVENNIMLLEGDEYVSETAKMEEFLKKDYIQLPSYFPIDKKQLLLGINQLKALKEMLVEIFNNVYPTPANLTTYGHSIKNLLVLSCIEVETQLKGVFVANETTAKTRYNTTDYVKLNDILHLNKYEVRFPFYPDLYTIKPFENWTASVPGPTASIPWYDGYNAIKHNSELDFHKANLENAIAAVAAVAVILQSQYGKNVPFWRDEIGGFFEIKHSIQWSIDEKYLPPVEGQNWTTKRLGL